MEWHSTGIADDLHSQFSTRGSNIENGIEEILYFYECGCLLLGKPKQERFNARLLFHEVGGKKTVETVEGQKDRVKQTLTFSSPIQGIWIHLVSDKRRGAGFCSCSDFSSEERFWSFF